MSAHVGVNRSETWGTPEDVLAPMRRYFGAPGLDPCTTTDNPVGAARFFTEADDGLSQPWGGGGMVYCNPPYRAPWYAKIAEEASSGVEILALLMARPGANYFQTLAELASLIGFWRGRLTFNGAPQTAAFESALIYFGPDVGLFRRAFRSSCWIVPGGSLFTSPSRHSLQSNNQERPSP